MEKIKEEQKNLDSLMKYIHDELIQDCKNKSEIIEAVKLYAESFSDMKIGMLGIDKKIDKIKEYRNEAIDQRERFRRKGVITSELCSDAMSNAYKKCIKILEL